MDPFFAKIHQHILPGPEAEPLGPFESITYRSRGPFEPLKKFSAVFHGHINREFYLYFCVAEYQHPAGMYSASNFHTMQDLSWQWKVRNHRALGRLAETLQSPVKLAYSK